MKTKLLITAIGMSLFLNACQKDDIVGNNVVNKGMSVSSSHDDTATQYPAAIDDYIAANYPGLTLVEVEVAGTEDNPAVAFEAYLSDDTELYFDADGNFLFSETDTDDDDVSVSEADIPQAILDAIAANYPDASIHEIEMEQNGAIIEVELDNGLELYFDSEGNFLNSEMSGAEDDDDDEDGNDDNGGDNDDDGDDDGIDDNGGDDDGDDDGIDDNGGDDDGDDDGVDDNGGDDDGDDDGVDDNGGDDDGDDDGVDDNGGDDDDDTNDDGNG